MRGDGPVSETVEAAGRLDYAPIQKTLRDAIKGLKPLYAKLKAAEAAGRSARNAAGVMADKARQKHGVKTFAELPAAVQAGVNAEFAKADAGRQAIDALQDRIAALDAKATDALQRVPGSGVGRFLTFFSRFHHDDFPGQPGGYDYAAMEKYVATLPQAAPLSLKGEAMRKRLLAAPPAAWPVAVGDYLFDPDRADVLTVQKASPSGAKIELKSAMSGKMQTQRGSTLSKFRLLDAKTAKAALKIGKAWVALAGESLHEMSDDTGAHTQPGDVIHFTTSGGKRRRAHAKKVLKNGVVIAGGEVIPFDAIHYVDASRTERTTNERTGDARDYGVGPDRDAAVPVASRSYKGNPADVEAPTGGDDADPDAPPPDDEDVEGPKNKEELIGFSLREVQAYFDIIVAKGSTFAVALKETQDKFKIKGLKVSPIGRIIPVEGLPRGKSPKAAAPPPPMGGDLPPDDGGGDGEEEPPDDGSGDTAVPPDDGGGEV